MAINKQNSDKYIWGNECFGWNLLNNPSLSVIQETMPAGTQEALHFYQKSQQLFYILNDMVTFSVDGEEMTAKSGEGIHIKKSQMDQISNQSQEELVFLVIFEPHYHGDKDHL